MDSRPNSPTPTYIHSSPPHTEHTEAAMFLNLLVMVDIFSSESFIQARNQRLPRMVFFFWLWWVFSSSKTLRLFVAVRGLSLMEACGLLVAVVSVVAEHRL